jgi:hypothetical protein
MDAVGKEASIMFQIICRLNALMKKSIVVMRNVGKKCNGETLKITQKMIVG